MLSTILSFIVGTNLQPITIDNDFPIETNITNLPSTLEISKNPELVSPIIYAESAIVVDYDSEKILYKNNIHERLPIASITKLMTAIIILEENKLDEIVTVSSKASTTEGSTMELQTGEELTVENLLKGLLIQSGNDAAVALAEHNSGSVEDFVAKMNQKAEELELINTHFSNPNGLEDFDNYSSAAEIAKIAKIAFELEEIQEIVSQEETIVYDENGIYIHNLQTTNELLNNDFYDVIGLKTGTTDLAGLCFAAISENENGNRIITVVLNSPDRFQETKILVDWIFRAYQWI